MAVKALEFSFFTRFATAWEMVRVVEFRVCMPLSMEEYERGFIFALAKTTEQTSKDGEGVETKRNEHFVNPEATDPRMEEGAYALKVLHMGARVPKLVRLLTPKNALMLVEESWNCFPYCKTVYASPYFGKRFTLTVESMVLADDRGEHPNALHLSEEQLKMREIDYVDIVEDEVESNYIEANEDPAKFASKLTGRGPLKPEFYKTCEPCICVYKVVTVNLDFGPFQKKAEALCLSAGMRDLLVPFHRQIFCWIDEWYGLSLEDAKLFEKTVQDKINKELQFGSDDSVKMGDDAAVLALHHEYAVESPVLKKKDV